MASVTLTEFAGDTFERSVNLTNEAGDPIDITGWTFVLSIKAERDDPDSEAVVRKEVSTHVSPTDGTTQLTIPETETADLLGDYYYDIKYKDDTGFVDTVVTGVIRFEESITDSI